MNVNLNSSCRMFKIKLAQLLPKANYPDSKDSGHFSIHYHGDNKLSFKMKGTKISLVTNSVDSPEGFLVSM